MRPCLFVFSKYWRISVICLERMLKRRLSVEIFYEKDGKVLQKIVLARGTKFSEICVFRYVTDFASLTPDMCFIVDY